VPPNLPAGFTALLVTHSLTAAAALRIAANNPSGYSQVISKPTKPRLS